VPQTERPTGSRKLHVPDWPYGAVGRRLLLEALLLESQPENGWTKTSLESKAQTETRGIDGLLAGAISWRLIERREDGRWQRAMPKPEIATPLEELLRLTRKVSDEPISPLPKRRYRRR
jgi:hypothetical protein